MKYSIFKFVFSPQNLKGSLLESDKKRKGRPKGKGNKRKTTDLQEVDGEVEAILQKKGKWVAVEAKVEFALREGFVVLRTICVWKYLGENFFFFF